MTQPAHLMIHDGDLDLEKIAETVSFIKKIIAAIHKGRGKLDGDSVISLSFRDGSPCIMLQRNWQVTDVIRLNVWEKRRRLVFNLAIKGCTGHPLHPDPLPEELVNHDRKILETVLPYLENIRPSTDAIMSDIDDRITAISALHPGAYIITAPSVCNTLAYARQITAATTQVQQLDPDLSNLLWQDLPKLAVLSLQLDESGSVRLTIYPYKVMTEPVDPVERLRLISTLPLGALNQNEEKPK